VAQTSNGSNILYFLPHRLGRPVWAGGVTEAIRTVSRKPSGFRAAVPARAKAREGAAARLPPRPPHGPRAPLRNRFVSRAVRPARSRFRRRRRCMPAAPAALGGVGPNPRHRPRTRAPQTAQGHCALHLGRSWEVWVRQRPPWSRARVLPCRRMRPKGSQSHRCWHASHHRSACADLAAC
jgi:hypothetical protein